MRVLLLNPLYKQSVGKKYERYFIRSGSRWPHSGVKLRGVAPHYLPFPFSLAYAASCLKSSSFDVQAIDGVALNMSEEMLLQQIARINPKVIFYEFTTPTVDYDLYLAKKIKELINATVVIGGAHAAYFAPTIIQKHKSVDFVIRGDYEYVLADLMQTLERGQRTEIAGVVHLADGAIVDNGYPIDEEHSRNLRVPLRDIFPYNDRPNPTLYWDGFCQYRPALQVQSSRGCKYKCSFCLNSQQEGRPRQYRVASAQQICAEIEEAMQKYYIREVYFDDDNFTQDMQHVDSIFQSMQERKRRIKWSGMASFSSLTEEIVQRLASYGCIGLKLGIESGSNPVLRSITKSVDLKSVASIIARCRKCGIKTHLTFSIGFLDETLDDIKKTICYAQSLDADSIQVSIATPLPGTEFFEMAKARGLLTNATWENYDAKRTSVIYPLNFYKKTLGRIRKDFLRNWFLRKALSPSWLIAHIPIIFRTLRGIGLILFCKQLTAIFIDESKNS